MAITIHLTGKQAEGLAELIYWANQGYNDFTETADMNGYTAQDKANVAHRWQAAQEAVAVIEQQCQGEPEESPLMDALEEFTALAEDWYGGEVWEKTQCVEAEAAAKLYRLLGKENVAKGVIEAHARADDDEEDQHYFLYLQQQAER